MNQEELNYLNLLQNILDNGEEVVDRTGVGTKFIFGTQLRFSLKDNKAPLLTTKKMFTKGIIEELLFFLRGQTDTKILEAKGVNIWKGNTSREFLDKRGLYHLKEGDMGKGYGYQWRNFNGHNGEVNYTSDELICSNGFIDQIKNVIKSLRDDPFSRRHLVVAWNPAQLYEMSLPPCHWSYEFNVHPDKSLSCMFHQRSVDSFLGLPFNIMSYALLTKIIAKATNLTPREVIFIGGNTHIYLNHLEQTKEQISRTPFDFPTCEITKEIFDEDLNQTVENIENLSLEDFKIEGYKSHSSIEAKMAV
ncbi:MAG: thymidylate synthase [Chitinophagales bacterium]|nr:thymidylate synthase [Chitinophagales bacterium]